MANIKISELEELTTVADDDVLPIVDVSENETKKVNKSNIIDGLIKENTDAVLTNVVSRNILNIFNMNSKNNLKVDDKGNISSTGISSNTWSYSNSDIYMTLSSGTYTLSAIFSTQETVSGRIDIYNSDNTLLRRIELLNTNKAIGTFTLSSTTNLGIMIKISKGIFKLQLEKNSIATDYTPYLNLQELEKTSRNISINYSKVFNNTKMTISDTNNKNEISLIGNIVIFNIIGNIQSALSSNTYVEIGNIADLPITPSKNISFTVLNSTKMLLGFGYFQSSTGNIRIKFSGAVSANDEIIIKTTYTI